MNIFEQASRLKLRFDLNGQISVEELWQVKAPILEKEEAALQTVVEGYGKRTRRSASKETKEEMLTKLKLEIITHILDVKEAEAEAAINAQSAKEQNQPILEIILRKKQAELDLLPIAELEKMLK